MTSVAQSSGPVCLLDASIYIFRYYFSMPDHCFSEQGFGTGAVFGYTQFLMQFLLRQQPEMMAACFDESLHSGFRNQLYEHYKSSRVLPDEALAFQLNACKEVTGLLGVSCFASDRYEADDLLGSLMSWLLGAKASGPVVTGPIVTGPIALLTRDKDLGQLLLRPEDFLWDYNLSDQSGTGRDGSQRLYREDIYAKFGVWPEQFVDYLALVGDSIDDIPGVPGVGAKTAQALLQFAGTIDQLFQQLPQLRELKIRGSKTLPEKLQQYQQQIALSQKLAAIVTDIEMNLPSQGLLCSRPDREGFADFSRRMGLPSGSMRLFDQLMESR